MDEIYLDKAILAEVGDQISLTKKCVYLYRL